MRTAANVIPFPAMPREDVPLGKDPLLEAVGAGPADRVLVLGHPGAVTLSDVMRRGCRGVALFAAPPDRPEPAEVVVAPSIRSEEAGRAVAECARQALPVNGRLALRLIGDGTAALARVLVARLRAYGFDRVRLRGQAESALLVCRLPTATRAR